MLNRGRIDILVAGHNVMAHHFCSADGQDLTREAGIAGEDKIDIAFSPDNGSSTSPALLLDEALREMQISGRLVELAAKYGFDLRPQLACE